MPHPNFTSASFNPKGRPKGLPGLGKKCREWADKYGIPFLQAIVACSTVTDKDTGVVQTVDMKTRVAAAIYLINRGYGTPKENIIVDGEIELHPVGKQISSDPESSRIATQLIQRISMEKNKDADGS